MIGAEEQAAVATAVLPSGKPIKVQVVGSAGGDGMASVGIVQQLNLDDALETISEIGSAAVNRLKAARPSRATVEFRLAFAVESGKLTSMIVGGRGDASLTVTLEWSGDADKDTDD